MNLSKLIVLFCMLTHVNCALATEWELTKRIDPKYPIEAARNGMVGCATLQFFIDINGKVKYVESLASSNAIFEENAIKALAQWEYSSKSGDDSVQRETVQLDFSLLDENGNPVHPDSSLCAAQLTNESYDIEDFRQNRLNIAMFTGDKAQWQSAINRIPTVLNTFEAKLFEDQLSSILGYPYLHKDDPSHNDSRDNNEKIAKLNGLDYYQIMAINMSLQKQETDKTLPSLVEVEELPLTPRNELLKMWAVQDMYMSMSQEAYKEISQQMLNVEIVIHPNGSAELLSTCRTVSQQMQDILKEQISDWKIGAKREPATTSRFIFTVPAPADQGSYLLCDADWFSEDGGATQFY